MLLRHSQGAERRFLRSRRVLRPQLVSEPGESRLLRPARRATKDRKRGILDYVYRWFIPALALCLAGVAGYFVILMSVVACPFSLVSSISLTLRPLSAQQSSKYLDEDQAPEENRNCHLVVHQVPFVKCKLGPYAAIPFSSYFLGRLYFPELPAQSISSLRAVEKLLS